MLSNDKRTATITTTSTCELAVLSRYDYSKVLKKVEQKNMQAKADFLKMLPIYQHLTAN